MAAALAELRRKVRSLRLAALQQPPGRLLERVIVWRALCCQQRWKRAQQRQMRSAAPS